MKNNSNDYVIRVLESPLDIDSRAWNGLLALQSADGTLNPFMRHEYLAAMHQSGSATPSTGWTPRFVTLQQGGKLAGACALYLKDHSYGEYVFDHAWAQAYNQHGLAYYPKALVAAPFTPVPGARLLARNAEERLLLINALIAWCKEEKLSSLHLLFADEADVLACEEAGLMLRHTVQFHWTNVAPILVTAGTTLPHEGAAAPAALQSRFRGPNLKNATTDSGLADMFSDHPEPALPFTSFDDFLMSLSQEKRKKIRQERRKVADAGIRFRWSQGKDISAADWDFFYACYERTYYEHGNAPYLSRDFFQRMQDTMPENWLLFVGEHCADGETQSIATSLIAISAANTGAESTYDIKERALTAYGRYWGALARVDCLHFEACYYQPLAWCIEHGYQRFEGGAQGEHKMARALLPVKTTSAHWLAHPAFSDAVERFLEREGTGITNYMDDLGRRSPFRVSSETALITSEVQPSGTDPSAHPKGELNEN